MQIVYLVEYKRGVLVFDSRKKQTDFYDNNQPHAGRMWSQPLNATVSEVDAYRAGQGNGSTFK